MGQILIALKWVLFSPLITVPDSWRDGRTFFWPSQRLQHVLGRSIKATNGSRKNRPSPLLPTIPLGHMPRGQVRERGIINISWIHTLDLEALDAGPGHLLFRSGPFFCQPPAGLFSFWFYGCCCCGRTIRRTAGVTRLLWGWNLTRHTREGRGKFSTIPPENKTRNNAEWGRGAILIGW